MICNLCHGMGNLFCIQQGKCEWFICPGCSGNGVRGNVGSKEISIGKSQQKFCTLIDDSGNVLNKRRNNRDSNLNHR
jgi:hypothetical protein